jgi:Ran GTPase-activating protein (RanGAP) involved in mRNA processing and transport
LDGEFSFPENLQSLKLYGNLVKLPEWIQGLRNLVKLKLRSCRISEHAEVIQVLGNLPNMASLHLLTKSFEQRNACLTFRPHMFPNLVVLELDSLLIDMEHINKVLFLKFEQGATPKLELLKFRRADINSRTLSGLPSLASLKEVLLEGPYDDYELAYLRGELAENPSLPVIKRV